MIRQRLLQVLGNTYIIRIKNYVKCLENKEGEKKVFVHLSNDWKVEYIKKYVLVKFQTWNFAENG